LKKANLNYQKKKNKNSNLPQNSGKMFGHAENQQNPTSLFDVPKDKQLMSTLQPLTI